MTIVQQDSCFCWETDSFLCVKMAQGKESRWSFFPSHVNSWGRRAETRLLSWWGACFESQQSREPRQAGNPRPVTCGAPCFWVSSRLWENEWTDECVTQSDDGIRGERMSQSFRINCLGLVEILVNNKTLFSRSFYSLSNKFSVIWIWF